MKEGSIKGCILLSNVEDFESSFTTVGWKVIGSDY